MTEEEDLIINSDMYITNSNALERRLITVVLIKNLW